MNDATDHTNCIADDQSTGFPALRTWRGVYLVVIGIFCVWVVLLTALSRAFR
jgi:hypothetical protein